MLQAERYAARENFGCMAIADASCGRWPMPICSCYYLRNLNMSLIQTQSSKLRLEGQHIFELAQQV
jgi:hypothetical protein